MFDLGFFKFWNHLKVNKNINFSNRTISISSGLKDEFIDEEWTQTNEIIHISTMELNEVWLETDHKCIIWCNQIMRFKIIIYLFLLKKKKKKCIYYLCNFYILFFKRNFKIVIFLCRKFEPIFTISKLFFTFLFLWN